MLGKKLEKELEKKVEKYKSLTEKALAQIKLAPNLSEKDFKVAEDFLQMAKNYFNDACFFQKQGNLLTSLAAFSYAHAWLDAGCRAKFFQATDDQLFTLP